MVHNEPYDPNALVDQRSFYGNGYNESIETTVEANDHSIQTPFVIAVWILSASIAKIGKSPARSQFVYVVHRVQGNVPFGFNVFVMGRLVVILLDRFYGNFMRSEMYAGHLVFALSIRMRTRTQAETKNVYLLRWNSKKYESLYAYSLCHTVYTLNDIL